MTRTTGPQPRVVVGIDGSDAALNVLDWAVAEAARAGATLHLVCCYSVPFYGEPGMFGAYAIESQVEAIKTEHEGFLAAALAHARAAGDGVAVDGVVTLAAAAGAITDEAGPTDLIVVGSTGRTGFVADTIGSVATAVCHRAHVPVVVVPATCATKRSIMKKIVVGVDGSPASEEALRWAFEEARLAGAEVVVVHAWSYPYGGGHASRSGADPREQMKLDALRQLEASIDSLAGKRDDGPSVHARLTEDSAAKALIDEAADADLVVVGSRGRGGFTALLLGSVSRAVVQHAPCPVAVIRHAA